MRIQKADTPKDDELNLLCDEDMESFTGSQAYLETAADNFFTSPPRPQPLRFESLSLKTPAKIVSPTPGTDLQQKIESNFKKSLGSQFNIQLQQQMGVFQASMLETNFSLSKRRLKKWRWIRLPLQPLSRVPVNRESGPYPSETSSKNSTILSYG